MQTVESEFFQTLRSKINNWSKSEIGKANRWLKYILLTPDILHLIVKLLADEELPANYKGKLATAISYFMSPLDFIPETYWGAIGYVDDIVLAVYVMNLVMQETGAAFIEKHWEGPQPIIGVIQNILVDADKMVGPDYWSKLQALVK
ncbi:MAG: DUF1232 domain-containing protein [Candidatus Neomarinimicrobiota bacterium]